MSDSAWTAITPTNPPEGHGILVALIKDNLTYRVAIAQRTPRGFYELYSGKAAPWATHWAQNYPLEVL